MDTIASSVSKVFGAAHANLVAGRRVRTLSKWFAQIIPTGVRVLDVGCGDGQIAAALQQLRPDISVRGIDVLLREGSVISVEPFDGTHIPFVDSSFGVVLFSDVLHHSTDPTSLLREARRVASQGILIKDHYCKGFAARARLRFMDWVGNARYGVALPYNYWDERQWRAAWRTLGLQPKQLHTRLRLYSQPAGWIFEGNLHFIAFLENCEIS